MNNKSSNFLPKDSPKIIAFILTYNSESLLEKAYKKIPLALVDEVIVVDDFSTDQTSQVAKRIGVKFFQNSQNLGYGGNLKFGLEKCFQLGADFAVEIHGDGAQFNPIAIQAAIPLMKENFDLILGSRFINPKKALMNGMPLIRYIANRSLTFFDRIVFDLPLTEFHTGFRIYNRNLYNRLPLDQTRNSSIFSFEVIAQAKFFNLRISEVEAEADYVSEHSSLGLIDCSVYALQTFAILFKYLLARNQIYIAPIFRLNKPRLD